MNFLSTVPITTIVLNFILHSTILLSIGFMVASLLQWRGAALQSAVLRTTLCFTLLAPAISTAPIFLGVPGLTLALPGSGDEKPLIASVAQAPISNPPETKPATTTEFNPVDFHNLTPPKSFAFHAAQPAPAIHSALIERIVSASWFLISAFLFLRLGIRHRCVKRLRRSAHPNAEIERLCRKIANELGVACPQILIHPSVRSPLLLGYRRPAILFPESSEEAGAASREVILHELAHLIRRDVLWNYLCRFSECLFFFQPLLWAFNRQIGKTSDHVCDDYVVQNSPNRADYARQLTCLAEQMQPTPPESAFGAGVVSFRSSLGKRVQRILDHSRALTLRAGRASVASILILGLVGSTLTGLIGFQHPTEKHPNETNKTNLAAINDAPQTEYEPSPPGELLPAIESQPVDNQKELRVELPDCRISLIAALSPTGADWTPAGEKFDWNEWIRLNVEEPYQSKAIEYRQKIDGWREDYIRYIEGYRGINSKPEIPIGVLFSIKYSSEKRKPISIDRDEKSAIGLGSDFPMMITPTLQLYSIRGNLHSNDSPLDIETIITYGPYLREKLYIAPGTRNITTVFLDRIMTVSVNSLSNPQNNSGGGVNDNSPIQSQRPPKTYPGVSITTIESNPLQGYEVFAVTKDGAFNHWSSIDVTEWHFPITNENIDYFLYCGRRIRPVIWKGVEMKNAQNILKEIFALQPKQPVPDSLKDSPTIANATPDSAQNKSVYYLDYFQRYLGMLSRDPDANEKIKNFLADVDWDRVFKEFERASNYNLLPAIQDMMVHDLELERAALLAQKMLERQPQNYGLLMVYETLLLKQDRYRDAMPVIDRLLALKPDQPETMMNKAFILKTWKQYEESEKCYKQVLGKQPANPYALAGLVSLYKILGKDPRPLIEENLKVRGLSNGVTETDIAVPIN